MVSHTIWSDRPSDMKMLQANSTNECNKNKRNVEMIYYLLNNFIRRRRSISSLLLVSLLFFFFFFLLSISFSFSCRPTKNHFQCVIQMNEPDGYFYFTFIIYNYINCDILILFHLRFGFCFTFISPLAKVFRDFIKLINYDSHISILLRYAKIMINLLIKPKWTSFHSFALIFVCCRFPFSMS